MYPIIKVTVYVFMCVCMECFFRIMKKTYLFFWRILRRFADVGGIIDWTGVMSQRYTPDVNARYPSQSLPKESPRDISQGNETEWANKRARHLP